MRKYSEADVVLVLTGCVIPNCNCGLKVTDINIRKKHYYDSIRWYLENTPYKIVFCENSGTDMSGDFHEYCDRIEFVTYISSKEEGENRSKGYKEMEILQYAWNNSDFIKNGGVFVKITGRLILKNIESVINHLVNKKTTSFFSSYQNARLPMADCRFFFFTKDVWPILLSYKEKIFHCYNFEHVMYDIYNECKNSGIKFIYPPYLFDVTGVSGGYGYSYEVTKGKYFIYSIKHFVRWFFFGIGLLPNIKKK